MITTPHQAELNAADRMRQWGYLDAVSTTGGADGGIDVRSSKALAQVKFRGTKAGRPELQNLYGARAGDTTKALMFFDFKGYSAAAIKYADLHGIALYVYDTSGAVSSVNAAGRRLMATTLKTRALTLLQSPGMGLFCLLALGLALAFTLIILTYR